MKTLPVAVQIYSVRDEAKEDFIGTMHKLKAMGYDGVELAGLYGYEPDVVRRMLTQSDLKPLSAHVPFSEFAMDTERTIDDYITIGCEYIVLPYLPENMRPAACDFRKITAEIERIGKASAKKGVTLLYHNHEFEFEKMDDGSYCLDYIFTQVPEGYLKVQPDTCWIHVAGVDPVAYMHRYAGRCPIVHLKDFLNEKTNNMYELIGIDKKSESSDTDFRFCPLGHGKQNVPQLLQASLDIGAKWVVVEQDASPERPPLEAVQMSREYLRSLGW